MILLIRGSQAVGRKAGEKKAQKFMVQTGETAVGRTAKKKNREKAGKMVTKAAGKVIKKTVRKKERRTRVWLRYWMWRE